MKSLPSIILISCCLSILSYSQNINNLQELYESFNYRTVITRADSILKSKELLSDDWIIKIYTLKGASHFTLGEFLFSRKSFIEILKIDEKYQLDSVTYSPKLIGHFNEVKQEYLDIIKSSEEKQNDEIEKNNFKDSLLIGGSNLIQTAIIKSILLPGLGHFNYNNDTKGWLLTGVGGLTLGSMIYFIIDTYSKEKKYLNAQNPILVQTKYDEYNKSYKIRNSLIITYAVVWLYSQIDLLVFSDSFVKSNFNFNSESTGIQFQSTDIQLSIQIPL